LAGLICGKKGESHFSLPTYAAGKHVDIHDNDSAKANQPLETTVRIPPPFLFVTLMLEKFPFALLSVAVIAHAADSSIAPAAAALPKPAWLTDLSVGIQESYDNSVFLSGVNRSYLPPVYVVPAGSVAALANRWSWVTTVSPKVGVNFAPLPGKQAALQTLSFSYTPDYAFYHNEPSETFQAHRFNTGVKAGADDFTLGLENAFAYVDGNHYGPTYPGGYVTAYNVAAPRERREQIQDRATVSFQYGGEKWFVRPTASLLYYDLMTEQINVTGYQNYVDRYDVNGGLDFGCKIAPDLALTLGYRYGHQYQQPFSFSPYSSPNDYQRGLVGLEGKPWPWLAVKIQAGPDLRNYADNSASHITPVNDPHLLTYYGEASLTATISSKDTVTMKYKGWQWVSSVGKVPYFDSTYALNYHRVVTDKLGLDLGGRWLTANYNSGNLPACKRDDWQYTVSADVGYAVTAHVAIHAAYALDLGRNAQDGIPNPETREYDHQLVSVGTILTF
jgi:hypothetical protein